MRTRTITRWRRAALAGVLAGSLALPARAQGGPKAQAQAAAAKAEAAAASTDAAATQVQPAVQEKAAAAPDAQAPAAGGETAPMQAATKPQASEGGQPVAGAPDEYTVQKGDTLWDLSQKFLANPWYWPKIWSLNPGIENPHWIYPGNKLRLVPGDGGAQAPAQLQAELPPDAQQEDAPLPVVPGDGASVSVNTTPQTADVEVVRSGSRESELATSSVAVTGKLAFTPPPVVNSRSSGLVTPDELAAAGSLDASFEERQMLSTWDTGYVRFPGEVPVRPGEKLVIFRDDGVIVHPISHRKLANKTKNVGVMKVLGMKGDLVIVQIEQVFEEIERGDRVRPWVAPSIRVAPRPNTQDVSGVVVMANDPGLTTFGEQHQVFIDRGTADGVMDGNTFAVVRHGDGLNNKLVTGNDQTAGEQGARAAKVKTPDENVGLLLVVEAKEHLSMALVVKSVRELEPGDNVEMHANGAGGGGF